MSVLQKEQGADFNRTISIFSIISTGNALTSEGGQLVYDMIAYTLSQDRHITLSFHNIKSLGIAFLQQAIGQLYSLFPAAQIKSSVHLIDIGQEDLALIKRVVDNAKKFLKLKKKKLTY